MIPSGITYTLVYPSLTATRAAEWLAIHLRLLQ